MKKISWRKGVKMAFGILGGLVALTAAGMAIKFYGLSPKMRPAPSMTAPSTPEAIARGKYLATNVTGCVACHSEVDETAGDLPKEGRLGVGRDLIATPDGKVHIRTSNITPDKETGIGTWTDGEIARSIREGVDKNGHTLFPQMPYTTFAQTLSDGEILDIIAYLHTLPAQKNAIAPTDVAFPISMFIRAVPQPLDTPAPPQPSPSDKAGRGAWLLKSALCAECHDSVDDHMQKIPGKGLAGGFTFPLPGGKHVRAPNITSDKATGIGAYSDADIRRALEEGKGKDGRSLIVMPWGCYKDMTNEDKDALIAAVRGVPAVSNIVVP